MQTFLRVTCLALLLAVGASHSAEPQLRFHSPIITVEQWRQYLAEVLATPDIERRDSARQITLTDSKTMTIYAFTKEANPAHPAVVVRTLVIGPTGADVRRIGNYAGDLAAFTKWWSEFGALDAQIRDELRQ